MRAAVAIALLVFAPGGWADPATRTWSFRVYLGDAEIGTHVFTLVTRGDRATLRSEAHFRVKILFVNAYRYDHTAEETWRGDCLSSMSSRTTDGGDELSVEAVEREGRLEVDDGSSKRSLTGCVMSFAYWNPSMLAQRNLLNALTGGYDAVQVTELGDETISVAGKPLSARRHRLKSEKLQIDLWYSPAGEWLGLESTTESGKRLSYRLQAAPAP